MTYFPQSLLSTQASAPYVACDTTTGTVYRKTVFLHWEAVLIQEMYLQLSPFSTFQFSSYASPHAFSTSQSTALATLHLSPVPSLLHHYSRWSENGTTIKTNSLDQVLHFSLSEQLGRMKADK